jgi:hypothetical protein
MAGKLIIDTIQTESTFLQMNVSNTRVATINASGIYSNTGTKMIGYDGTIGVATIANTSISGVITNSQLDVATANGTGAIKLPTGTTQQRPSGNVAGYIRYNTTLGYPEWYDANNGVWTTFTKTTGVLNLTYLVIAGGGGGGGSSPSGVGAGGGGAGGLLTGTLTLNGSTTYSITVGSGGNGGTASAAPAQGTNGGASVFSSVSSLGGGIQARCSSVACAARAEKQ